MAAHDFEDLLQVCFVIMLAFSMLTRPGQCAIPVFDGLLPEPHNQAVMKLLFVMAHWHALAKLRMHNDCTLDVMEAVTVSLGNELRRFSHTTCSVFATKELRREYNARLRRKVSTAAKKSHEPANPTNQPLTEMDPSGPSANDPSSVQPCPEGQRLKTFNLSTFKCHSLGDYVNTIRQYGTSDSYSTEPVHV